MLRKLLSACRFHQSAPERMQPQQTSPPRGKGNPHLEFGAPNSHLLTIARNHLREANGEPLLFFDPPADAKARPICLTQLPANQEERARMENTPVAKHLQQAQSLASYMGKLLNLLIQK